MTERLYLDDSYLRETAGRIAAIGADGRITLDRTIFYPGGGGQPADSGTLSWDQGQARVIAQTANGQIELLPSDPPSSLEAGMSVIQNIDWERRYRHMRIHTALHLLSVVVPLPVTGGSIGDGQGRLDFDMPDAPSDRDALAEALQELIDRDLPISQQWITDEQLAAQPQLVKTMSVKPPRGSGRVRLIAIGTGRSQIDLQPCGGTHVASTAEIGPLDITKIQKKGRRNRRFSIALRYQ